MHLSQRLEAIASMIPAAAVVADIGGDRGQLSYALLERGIAAKGILTDISLHAIASARPWFTGTSFHERIDFRCGPGFSVLQPGEAQVAVLAGMGGGTIIKILATAPKIMHELDFLLIQAMRDTEKLRRFLAGSGMRICDEKLIYEDGIFYTIVKAENGSMRLDERAAMAGPVLLARNDSLLADYLAEYIAHRESILQELAAKNQGLARQEVLVRELVLLRELYHEANQRNIGRT